MVEILINGAPPPTSLIRGVPYSLSAALDGINVPLLAWTATVGGEQVAAGIGALPVFTPTQLNPVTLLIRTTGDFGLFQDAAITLNVTDYASESVAGVVWGSPSFTVGGSLSASIVARSSTGTAPSSISWVLYRNSQPVNTGVGETVTYGGLTAGLYRIKGTAYTGDGPLFFDSTITVGTPACGRVTLPLPDNGGTLVYLGSVFTQNIPIGGGQASSLPYQLGSSTEDIFLLPGTTDWSFDIDPETGVVDDELVVRTAKGNWCLNGVAGGLTGESVGYDYGYAPVCVPAPTGNAIRFTVDLFKVHGIQYGSSNCRARIKCYRRSPSIYSYELCANSSTFTGGSGRRARKWAALFTKLDIQTDAVSGLNRLGTGSGVVSYSTPDVTSVPVVTLSADGTPDPVPGYSGLFFTDSNLYACYEADGYADVEAKAVSAIEGVRPCVISLQMFNGSKPVICNRIKRAYGCLSIYLTDGAVIAGSVVHVAVSRADGTASTAFSFTVDSTVYVDTDCTILRVAAVAADIGDYQFDETGLVVEFTVDDSGATESSLPAPLPTPAAAPLNICSTTYAATVLFDGACYTQPAYVPILDDDAVVVTPVSGCQDLACGPSSSYCYAPMSGTSANIYVPQPFGQPAPYVALASAPAFCYQNPVPQVNVNGTCVSLAAYSGTTAVELLAFSGTALCGNAYAYSACQTSYAPCLGYDCSIVVVYPVAGSPHPDIEYGGNCYFYSGSTQDYGTRSVVPVASVTPVTGCLDPACSQYNAAGDVIVYNDTQTGLEVPVRFDYLGYGIGLYGVAPERIDNWTGGLTAGSTTVLFKLDPQELFYTANGTGEMLFTFGLPAVPKQLVQCRAGVSTTYSFTGPSRMLSLLPGDTVFLRLANFYNRLPPQYRGFACSASWQPLPVLPRLYDTVTVPFSGSAVINAVGFCAYTAQGEYSFFGTLPSAGPSAGPINPDSYVTVTGQDGQEYSLISSYAYGDLNVYINESLPWYSGTLLNGPFVFKFYAGRTVFGAHGEMDLWLEVPGTTLAASLTSPATTDGFSYSLSAAPTAGCSASYLLAQSGTQLAAGAVALTVGLTTGTVTGLALGFTPAACVLTVECPDGSFIWASLTTTPTADGFSYSLSGVPPAGACLNYVAAAASTGGACRTDHTACLRREEKPDADSTAVWSS